MSEPACSPEEIANGIAAWEDHKAQGHNADDISREVRNGYLIAKSACNCGETFIIACVER